LSVGKIWDSANAGIVKRGISNNTNKNFIIEFFLITNKNYTIFFISEICHA